LLFIRENKLMAQPLDAGTAQASGDAYPIAVGIDATTNRFAPVAIGNNVLMYWSGATNAITGLEQVVWYDRSGKLLGPAGTPGDARMPSLSLDEKTITFARVVGGIPELWLRDLARGTDKRIAFGSLQYSTPFWEPNGNRIVFRHAADVYDRPANGSGQDELLVSTPNAKPVTQWSRDGQFIVYSENDPKTKFDIWVLPAPESGRPTGAASAKPIPFLRTQFAELMGQISPDGRWMAYTSDESGQRDVYVRPFPAAEGVWRISTMGGEQPRWRADGREMFYLGADGKLMAVEVKASTGPKPEFASGAPAPLFDAHMTYDRDDYFGYDVTADGKRFLVTTNASGPADSGTASAPNLNVLVNWDTVLRK
jgi:hypothetical protein